MGNQIQQEWATVSAAPFLTLGAIVVIGLAMWAVMHFLYKHRLDGLKEELDLERGANARLRTDLDTLSSKSQSAPPPPSSVDPAREWQLKRLDAQVQVDQAKRSARISLNDRRDRGGLDRARAKMESALLTAKKVYDIEIPAFSSNVDIDLSNSIRFFDEVWPLLAADHLVEGREKAAEFAAKINEENSLLG